MELKLLETGHSRLYCGNAMKIIPTLSNIDAVITDPPYSSGGFSGSDKQQLPSEKYQKNGTKKRYPEFYGDNHDQRSWRRFMALVFADCFSVMRDGGYIMAFADWRQLPLMTDIIQLAGFFWRGIVAWDKTLSARAPHRGYFRHQCEYIIWGTKGAMSSDSTGPFAGCIKCGVNHREKLHMTGKPLFVMQELVKPIRAGETILDPFMGSGTTGVAAVMQQSNFVGIELSPEYFEIAAARITQEESIMKTGLKQDVLSFPQ
jgi:site-specific DNA-methyltransferase (adenine-specific)